LKTGQTKAKLAACNLQAASFFVKQKPIKNLKHPCVIAVKVAENKWQSTGKNK